MNYFVLLGLTQQFDLDSEAVEQAYFAAQRLNHPDRFARKPAAERQQALQRSMDINQAYKTLKHPLSRAQYLLKLQGLDIGGEQSGVKPSSSVLMEAMELREQIEEVVNPAQLDLMETELQEFGAQIAQEMATMYRDGDWDAMAQATLRFNYCIKAQEDLRARRHRMKQTS